MCVLEKGLVVGLGLGQTFIKKHESKTLNHL